MTAPLTEPTSETIAPCLSAGAMARPIASLAPTGAQRMTQSALRTARARSSVTTSPSAKRLRALQNPDRMVGKNDAPRRVAPARGARDRRADQPDADDRQLFEDRLGERLPEPINHLCLA